MTYNEKDEQIKLMVNECCRVYNRYKRDHDPQKATDGYCNLKRLYGHQGINLLADWFGMQTSMLNEIYKKELQEERNETGKRKAR